MKTYSPKPRDIERRWYVIDASGAILGRLASEAAAILRGKHKPIFAPHMDTGDHVIVVNARGIRLSGGKEEKKFAYRHSGYPGGLTETNYARLLERKPHWAVEKAIKGMLPKNRLGRAMGKKLQVYPGPDHPHQAQKPQPLKLGEIPKWDGLPKPAQGPAPRPKATSRPSSTPSTAKGTTATSAAKSTTSKSTSKQTTRSTTKPAAKSTAKAPAKATTKTTTKTTTAKPAAKKSTARRSLRRKKEE